MTWPDLRREPLGELLGLHGGAEHVAGRGGLQELLAHQLGRLVPDGLVRG